MEELIWFCRGIMYGLIMLATSYIWISLTSWEFISHDNTKGKHGTDTVEIKKHSTARVILIGVASVFWPLTLALVLLYGLFCIPVLIYKKTGK